MDPSDDGFPCTLRINGLKYHHVTGFLECMRHRHNPEFANAIRVERSASIAREMGDPTTLKWADIDLEKRALTPWELRDFEMREEHYVRQALESKFGPGPQLQRALSTRLAAPRHPQATATES